MRLNTANFKKVFVVLFVLAALAVTAFLPKKFVGIAEAQRSGAAVYAQNCARCHGANGRAQTRQGRASEATDLTSDDWIPDAARDTRIVSRGKGSMPAFGKRLTQAQVSAAVQYIRRFKR
jgi:mono/diheme cytochrome c family protein